MQWTFPRRAFSIGTAVLLLATQLPGQVFFPGRTPQGVSQPTMSLVDPQLNRVFRQAMKLADERQYAQALPTLQLLLDRPEDSLIVDPKNPTTHVSLKFQIERYIGGLPQEAREQYELLQGPRAAGLLQQGLESGNVEAVVNVTRRYFHTKAGLHAIQWFGAYLFDRASPLAAGRCFVRARQHPHASNAERTMLGFRTALCWHYAGLHAKSAQLLRELREESPNGALRIGGRNVSLFDKDADPNEWLAAKFRGDRMEIAQVQTDWPVERGDASRNAQGRGGMPYLGSLWSNPHGTGGRRIRRQPRIAESHVGSSRGRDTLEPIGEPGWSLAGGATVGGWRSSRRAGHRRGACVRSDNRSSPVGLGGSRRFAGSDSDGSDRKRRDQFRPGRRPRIGFLPHVAGSQLQHTQQRWSKRVRRASAAGDCARFQRRLSDDQCADCH
ncbi:MAG: hypothetical protein O3A00_03955 [Planctomycetota bacterium]|nr:hypothetical protein [Planctomycetota bacterium]